MSGDSNGNGSSSWLSPKTVVTLGATTFISILLILVITGIIPTPLMQALRTIDSVQADHVGMGKIMEDQLYLLRIDCLRNSETPEAQRECYRQPPLQ